MEGIIRGELSTRTVYLNGIPIDPEPSQRAFNHSPNGYNWGYSGSGPAQLALAILMKFTGVEVAISLHQDFKWDVIAGLHGDFELPVKAVEEWLIKKGVMK
jgi:hypothetical protein